MFIGAGFCIEIEYESRQSRRTGCPEVLYRRQAERSGRQVYRRSAHPVGLGRRVPTGVTRCRECMAGVKQIEGMPGEIEESDQEGEGEDSPQG
jgi:hypothetical protein